MTFLWPWILPLLLLVPLAAVAYIWILRRKRRFAIRYSTLALIREAMPRRARWRQHVPAALFLFAIAAAILAFARPAAQIEVPLSRTTIILALDVSRSMCATDVPPNRLTVAQEAALAFVEEQAGSTQIGIVAFAGFAELIVPPTNDTDLLKDAISNLTTSLGTAIGSATLKSIDAIAEINEAVARSGVNLRTAEGVPGFTEGVYQPDIIVLLTDGANSRGPLPLDAAQQAFDRQVRVYTIGFGTTDIPDLVCTAEQLGSDIFGPGGFGFGGFGGPGGGDFRRFLVIDEPTLQGVADLTGGSYYRAENADQLFEVFRELPTQISLQTQNLELSALLAALAAIAAIGAVTLSLLWNRYP